MTVFDEASEYETKTLERIQLTVQLRVSARLIEAGIDGGTIEAFIDSYIADQIVFQAKTFVYGEQRKPVIIAHPESWLEALKERFMPEWLQKWWPIRYTVHEVGMKVLYPDYRPWPGQREVVKISHKKRVEK